MATRHVRRRGGGLSIKRRWSAAKKMASRHGKTALVLGALGVGLYGRNKSKQMLNDIVANDKMRVAQKMRNLKNAY